MIFRLTHVLCYLGFLLLIFLFGYIDLTYNVKVDFSSFYASILSFKNNLSPYIAGPLDFLSSSQSASINLNTPFFLLLLSPLSKLKYDTAFLLWQLGAFLSLVMSMSIILKKHQLYKERYLLAILFSFPVFMSFFIGQLAAYVLLLVTLGKYYLDINRPILTGFFWGIITGIKLFTGLLLFYLIFKKNYKALLCFMITLLLTILMPLLISGPDIYQQYLSALKSINWYMHAWNGSLLGFIERSKILYLFSDNQQIHKLFSSIILIFALLSYFYLMVMKRDLLKNKAFQLTIIYMLLLNPLGWFYYFLLLLEPLMSLISREFSFSREKKLCCILLFIFFAYPRHSSEVRVSSDLFTCLTTGSQYFYALIMILFLVLWHDKKKTELNQTPFYYSFLKIMVIFLVYLMTFYFTITNLVKLIGNTGEW